MQFEIYWNEIQNNIKEIIGNPETINTIQFLITQIDRLSPLQKIKKFMYLLLKSNLIRNLLSLVCAADVFARNELDYW